MAEIGDTKTTEREQRNLSRIKLTPTKFHWASRDSKWTLLTGGSSTGSFDLKKRVKLDPALEEFCNITPNEISCKLPPQKYLKCSFTVVSELVAGWAGGLPPAWREKEHTVECKLQERYNRQIYTDLGQVTSHEDLRPGGKKWL